MGITKVVQLHSFQITCNYLRVQTRMFDHKTKERTTHLSLVPWSFCTAGSKGGHSTWTWDHLRSTPVPSAVEPTTYPLSQPS